jgi:hypothetical protein
MQTVEAFMQNYFLECTRMNHIQEDNSEVFREKFLSTDYLIKLRQQWNEDAAYKRANPAIICSVEHHGETAEVIASVPEGQEQQYRRYHLRNTEAGWKIERKGRKCFSCNGSARFEGENCALCNGVGWNYYGASQTNEQLASPRVLARSMSQEIANLIKTEFERLTNINVSAIYMAKGPTHKPTTLSSGMCGVYVFMNDKCCFKVGKAGSKSKARWNSHHYNLDETTPSTLPKSIIKNKLKLKECFPAELHPEIDALDKSNIQEWIKNNMSRIEFLFRDDGDSFFALNLLEALAQFHLKPIFEGKNA